MDRRRGARAEDGRADRVRRSDEGVRIARPLQFGIVLLVCVLVFWVNLGAGGLTSTEGHRVLPAYAMLDRGDPFVPSLFGQAYLRKPPGMPWAVALTSALLGRTEFAARAVSALASTGMAMLACGIGLRWFGRGTRAPVGLAAGLATALTPWLWSSGRQAEIEALNNFGALAGALLLLDVLVPRPPMRRAVPVAVLAGLGWAIAGLAKGPASAPVLAATVAGACLARGSWRTLADPRLWTALGAAAAVLGPVGVAILLRVRGIEGAGETVVLQSPGDFSFEPERLAGVALLLPGAFVSALPASLALLFPWGPDARREAEAEGAGERFRLARGVSWAFLLAVAGYMLFGVGNVRYALPAGVLLPVLWADVAGGLDPARPGALLAKRAAIARLMLLWAPVGGRGVPLLPLVLLAGAVGVYIPVMEARDRATSGREAGEALGRAIAGAAPGGVVIVAADDAVEARPEVLHYAVRAARALGVEVRPRWLPGRDGGELAASADLAVLRQDSGSAELEQARSAGAVRTLGSWEVHEYAIFLTAPAER